MGQKYYKLAREILEENRPNVVVPLFETRLISNEIFMLLSKENRSFDLISTFNEPTAEEIQSVIHAIELIIDLDNYYFNKK